MKYQLAVACTPTALADHIMPWLQQSCQLQGGISVAPIDNPHFTRRTLIYAQALTFPAS